MRFGMPSPPPAAGRPPKGEARDRLNVMLYVIWQRIVLFLPQNGQKAPLKGVRTPGKQSGGLFPVRTGRQAPGWWPEGPEG